MPGTPFDPTSTAAPIGVPTKVNDGEVISDTSYQEGEFKPVMRAVRYQELHSLQDTTAAGVLGDPDDANGADYKLYGNFNLVDNGAQEGVLTAEANTSIVIASSADLTVQSGGTLDAQAGSHLTITTALATMGAGAVITAAPGAKIDGVLQYPSTSTVELFGRTRIPGYDSLSDTNHQLITGTTKQKVQMQTNPGAARTVILPEAAAWLALTGYTNATDYVVNGGKLYICSQSGTSAASGGPTGTGLNITDGTCKWDCVSPAPVAGDWYEITCLLGNSAFPIQIQRLSNIGTDVAQLTNSVFSTPGSGNAGSVRVRFDGTHWHGDFAGGCCANGGDW